MRRFVLCLTLCHFVLVLFSPFSIVITSLGEERANLSAFRTFVRFVLVWICRFPLPLGVWEGLRYVIVALPGLFSYLFLWLRTIDLSPALNFYWPFQGGASAVVFYFCHCLSLHGCPGEIFTLDSRLAYFWERNCPFGFLLVVLIVMPWL